MSSLKLTVFYAILFFAFAGDFAFGQPLEREIISSGDLSKQITNIFFLIGFLSLAPAFAIMVTCFPFIVTVLAILRQAIGLQQSPPNMVLVSLALFLSFFVMEPTLRAAWGDGVQPYLNDELNVEEALKNTIEPFRAFMSSRTDSEVFEKLSSLRSEEQELPDEGFSPLEVLIPSFMLSEISKAFEIGFLIFIPFLIIDLVVAAILMSMGMMMVPPAIVSLPFKLSFFVVADGWSLISTSLVTGYF